MNLLIQRIQSLLSAFADSKDRIHTPKLWDDFRHEAQQKTPAASIVIEALDWMIDNREGDYGEPLLVMAAASNDDRVLSRMCTIIESGDPTFPIENAIELLTDMEDSRAVPSLIHAVNYRFDHDPTLQIPKKALLALRLINDQRCLEHLRYVSESQNKMLAEEAQELLSDH